jgi:hypothetical protein
MFAWQRSLSNSNMMTRQDGLAGVPLDNDVVGLRLGLSVLEAERPAMLGLARATIAWRGLARGVQVEGAGHAHSSSTVDVV